MQGTKAEPKLSDVYKFIYSSKRYDGIHDPMYSPVQTFTPEQRIDLKHILISIADQIKVYRDRNLDSNPGKYYYDYYYEEDLGQLLVLNPRVVHAHGNHITQILSAACSVEDICQHFVELLNDRGITGLSIHVLYQPCWTEMAIESVFNFDKYKVHHYKPSNSQP